MLLSVKMTPPSRQGGECWVADEFCFARILGTTAMPIVWAYEVPRQPQSYLTVNGWLGGKMHVHAE